MKRITAVFLALLLLTLTCSALAENHAAALISASQELLFATDNVTLSGSAVFTLDGERFKTAGILYKQDGTNSHWQLDLHTPRPYRPDRETGFTVIANDERIFAMERFHPGVYRAGSDQPSNTIIRRSTRSDMLVAMLMSLSGELETLLLPANAVMVSEMPEGKTYQIALTKENTPPVLNSAMNLTADFLLRRFMNVNYDTLNENTKGQFENYQTVTQGILYSTDSFVLGDTSVTVSLDEKGRLVSASGIVTAILYPGEKTLVITFDCTVSDYGTTVVPEFDPEAFNVVSAGSEPPVPKEVDPALADKLIPAAQEILQAAGYEDVSSLPARILEQDACYNVIFQKEGEYAAITVTLNEKGELLALGDGNEAWYMENPHEPSVTSLSPETCSALKSFLLRAFPEIGERADVFVPAMEYTYNGVNYLYVSCIGADNEDMDFSIILRTGSPEKIVGFNCLPE